MTKEVNIFFGLQGSGKGTQASKLAEYRKVPYFEAGQELRNFTQSKARGAISVREIMMKGQLVPNHYLKELFTEFIADHDCSKGLVIDGFPRNIAQVELLEELAAEHGWEIEIIEIIISPETALIRAANRVAIVDGKEVKRDDDKPEIIKKRIETFHQQTVPIIKLLEKKHRYVKVDGEPDINTIAKRIQNSRNG